MCRRLVGFLTHLKPKIMKDGASVVRLSCVQLAESAIFADFWPLVVVLLLVLNEALHFGSVSSVENAAMVQLAH